MATTILSNDQRQWFEAACARIDENRMRRLNVALTAIHSPTGRERADEVTVFDSVGFALEDYSALRYLYALAQQHNAGVEIALIPPAVDPKNLFALIDDPAAIAQGHAAFVTEAVAAFAR